MFNENGERQTKNDDVEKEKAKNEQKILCWLSVSPSIRTNLFSFRFLQFFLFFFFLICASRASISRLSPMKKGKNERDQERGKATYNEEPNENVLATGPMLELDAAKFSRKFFCVSARPRL